MLYRVILMPVLCTLLFCTNLKAQSTTILDSLFQQLHKSKTYTDKVKQFEAISTVYLKKRNIQSARNYADSIFLIAALTQNPEAKAKSHFLFGKIGRFEGNYENALRHIKHYNDYYREQGDSVKLSKGLFQMGVIHRELGNYEKCLPYYYRVFKIRQATGKPIASVVNSIGIIYVKLNQLDQAITSYKQALAAFRNTGDQRSVYNCLHNLGLAYGAKKDFVRAKSFYLQSLQVSQKAGLKDSETKALLNLAAFHNREKTYQQALAYSKKALTNAEELSQNKLLESSQRSLGRTYMHLKQYEKALPMLNKSLAAALKIGAKPRIRDNYELLAELEVIRKNFANAYHYQRLYTAVNDSILNFETTNQILKLKAKYEHEQQQRKITKLTQEKEIERLEAKRLAMWQKALLAGVIMVLIIAGLLVSILSQKLKNQKIIAIKNEEIKTSHWQQKLSELELKALRAQMNPHFIFNCLNSINRVVLNGEAEKASRYLGKFSRLIRMVLENSEHNTVPLSDELNMLEIYMQLESLRFKSKVNYHMKVDPVLDQESTYIPSMVLQPLVENAIWHGLMHKHTGGNIYIDIKEDNGCLKCSVEDDGVGRVGNVKGYSAATNQKGKSFGLQIIQERLKLMSKKELQSLINIEDLKNPENENIGTRVNVLIPIP